MTVHHAPARERAAVVSLLVAARRQVVAGSSLDETRG